MKEGDKIVFEDTIPIRSLKGTSGIIVEILHNGNAVIQTAFPISPIEFHPDYFVTTK